MVMCSLHVVHKKWISYVKILFACCILETSQWNVVNLVLWANIRLL
jgi:hypothetical protein